MAIYLDETIPYRLYRGQFYYPIDLSNRMKNSVVYLLTPNTDSSINLLSNKLARLNHTVYQSYFIEKNINLVINSNLNKEKEITINNESVDSSILRDLVINESLKKDDFIS